MRFENACQKCGVSHPPTNRGPKTIFQLHNLTATLTAYIFGMKHDIDNRSSASTTRRSLLYRQPTFSTASSFPTRNCTAPSASCRHWSRATIRLLWRCRVEQPCLTTKRDRNACFGPEDRRRTQAFCSILRQLTSPDPTQQRSRGRLIHKNYNDSFYSFVLGLVEEFYPERTVTLTYRDPSYVTAGINAKMRRKNRLMRAGRVEGTIETKSSNTRCMASPSWRQPRYKCTSGFWCGDVLHLRRSKTVSIPNFDKISQSAGEIPVFETNGRHIEILLPVSIFSFSSSSTWHSATT